MAEVARAEGWPGERCRPRVAGEGGPGELGGGVGLGVPGVRVPVPWEGLGGGWCVPPGGASGGHFAPILARSLWRPIKDCQGMPPGPARVWASFFRGLEVGTGWRRARPIADHSIAFASIQARGSFSPARESSPEALRLAPASVFPWTLHAGGCLSACLRNANGPTAAPPYTSRGAIGQQVHIKVTSVRLLDHTQPMSNQMADTTHLLLDFLSEHPIRWSIGLVGLSLALWPRRRGLHPPLEREPVGAVQRQRNTL